MSNEKTENCEECQGVGKFVNTDYDSTCKCDDDCNKHYPFDTCENCSGDGWVELDFCEECEGYGHCQCEEEDLENE